LGSRDFAPPLRSCRRCGSPARRTLRVLEQHRDRHGPTPPGTGVMSRGSHPSTLWKSTSPASLPSASRLIPTSMTTAPGLNHGRRDEPGSTGRHHENVRLAGHRAQGRGFWSCSGDRGALLQEQQRHRLATMLLRPTTTACRPCTPISRARSLHDSEGRAGHEARTAAASRPILIG